MSYPVDTAYRGFIIRQHDPAYQTNSFQGFDTNGNAITLLNATADQVKVIIDERLKKGSGRYG
ncbi:MULTISPECIES: hypothetical protein [Pseudomonas]|jgi:hypothetical protein|uniref:Uncharacterized protein n=2 Tax=Pseudomonas TaxID=286 RepID=A0A109KIE1_PSEFL|nr:MULTISPECIES: hypothetical protein [Pseudomonas]KAA6191964.1 hypothetical protein F3K52_27925 [Pseudomonas lactis]KWV69795.1 hypothetical protein PFL603g_06242 [Pseudomonas fluorescens]MDY4300818.1 hypothetical protein [Pseudomonas salmasensis]